MTVLEPTGRMTHVFPNTPVLSRTWPDCPLSFLPITSLCSRGPRPTPREQTWMSQADCALCAPPPPCCRERPLQEGTHHPVLLHPQRLRHGRRFLEGTAQ